jgi:hypothetical protein
MVLERISADGSRCQAFRMMMVVVVVVVVVLR